MGDSIASRERQALASLLSQLGPDQPTLCEGWTTADLVAHLVLRERRFDAALGILGGPLANWNARVMTKASKNFQRNVELFKNGAPLWSPLRWFDSQANTLEMLVHHEDVRRAQPDWQPRDLSAIHKQIWELVTRSRRFWLRGTDEQILFQTPYGESAGAPGGQRVVGEPMELLLYLTGRTDAALVEKSS